MGKHLKDCMIYAVDFDGTLCREAFPGIGEPNERLIGWLIGKRKSGDKVILWTNRVGKKLQEAVEWCNGRGLSFDAVNENIPEVVELYAHLLDGLPPSPKVTADIFIDDSACGRGLPYMDQGCGLEDCWNDACIHNHGKAVRVPDIPITELNLRYPVWFALNNMGIRTLRDIVDEMKASGLKIRKSYVDEVRKVLADWNIRLEQ